MRDYVIITDSGADLSKQMVEQYDIKIVPMGLTIGGKTYRHYHDFRELSAEKFYSLINEGEIGTTSCVSIGDAFDEMEKYAKAGKDILYLSFSSGMSGSYQAAVNAANDLKEAYADVDVRVVDTLCGCIGLGMITVLAAEKKAEGGSLDDVENFANEIKLNICHYFVVDDLKYLQKTGRISHLKAMFGSILGIRPIFVLDNDGKVLNVAKARGRKAVLDHIVNTSCDNSSDKTYFFIAHAAAENDAISLQSVILDKYPNAKVIVNEVGPILGNNVGPGAIAIAFYGDTRC